MVSKTPSNNKTICPEKHFVPSDYRLRLKPDSAEKIDSISDVDELWIEGEITPQISNKVLRHLSTLLISDIPADFDTTGCTSLDLLVTNYSGTNPLPDDLDGAVHIMITTDCLKNVDFDKAKMVAIFRLAEKEDEQVPHLEIPPGYKMVNCTDDSVFGVRINIIDVEPSATA